MRGLLAANDEEATERLAAITRMITNSPALLARERQIFERYTHTLAELIAAETGTAADDIKPWVTANALIGVHRALVDYTRRQILAGRTTTRLTRDVRAHGKQALALLERGLGQEPLNS